MKRSNLHLLIWIIIAGEGLFMYVFYYKLQTPYTSSCISYSFTNPFGYRDQNIPCTLELNGYGPNPFYYIMADIILLTVMLYAGYLLYLFYQKNFSMKRYIR